MYHILPYTLQRAKQIGVTVKPSHKKDKKIDVFNKNGEYLCSVGFFGYNDYPTFIKKEGLEYANARRKLYKMRHEKDRHQRGSRGWFADQLLW
jgi:hypothetical protein